MKNSSSFPVENQKFLMPWDVGEDQQERRCEECRLKWVVVGFVPFVVARNFSRVRRKNDKC